MSSTRLSAGSDAEITGIDPAVPALVFGGVGAGIGALAGWGIGRNRDNNPSPDLGGGAPARSAR